jgi:hypothetical protein
MKFHEIFHFNGKNNVKQGGRYFLIKAHLLINLPLKTWQTLFTSYEREIHYETDRYGLRKTSLSQCIYQVVRIGTWILGK